jgi:ATP-dependent Clp protease adaptor protein ClpS
MAGYGAQTLVEASPVSLGLLEDLCEVILFNDDHNTAEFVVEALVKVFAHPVELAAKIMFEAHTKGKSIAEVEGETPATLHKQQLESLGLTAEVRRIR